MELLPRQIDVFIARQTVERTSLDRVNNFLGSTHCGYEIEPPSCGELRVVQSQDVFGNGIAAAKAVEEPSVQLLTLKRGLDGIDQRVAHDRIIPSPALFPSLAKEGLGVVRPISEQISADVDRTSPYPSFTKEGISAE